EHLSCSHVSQLTNAAKVIGEQDDLAMFLTCDSQGKHFPQFIQQLADKLVSERDHELDEVEALAESVQHIKDIVTAQETNVAGTYLLEDFDAVAAIELAIRRTEAEITSAHVAIVRDFSTSVGILGDQYQATAVVGSLLSNAIAAVKQLPKDERRIIVSARNEADVVRIDIEDNGAGISPDHLERIFQPGFSSGSNGGRSLHAGANTAIDLGGSLTAKSDGLGQGATFSLRLPMSTKTTTGVN
ncbi:MAG: sensor histidine kinase, partial [Planctomycetaceae bacterium]